MAGLDWLRLLTCLREGVNDLRDIAECSGLGSRAKTLINRLAREARLVMLEERSLLVPEGGRLSITLHLVSRGLLDVGAASKVLSWRDFESLASVVLEANGYVVAKGVRLPNRMEIDVVGVRDKFALVVDCKHWSRYHLSRLAKAAAQHRERTRALLKFGYGFKLGFNEALPVILTLPSVRFTVLEGSCIVPVTAFDDFSQVARGLNECLGLIIKE